MLPLLYIEKEPIWLKLNFCQFFIEQTYSLKSNEFQPWFQLNRIATNLTHLIFYAISISRDSHTAPMLTARTPFLVHFLSISNLFSINYFLYIFTCHCFSSLFYCISFGSLSSSMHECENSFVLHFNKTTNQVSTV